MECRGILIAMSGRAQFAMLAVLSGLAGCASVAGDPERTDVPHDAPYAMRSRMVAVCYSAQVSTPEQVTTAAAALCREPDTSVTLWREDLVLNGCPFFKKRRAAFSCNYPKK